MSQDDISTPLQGVAVVGLSGRFPGAPDVTRLWENLRAGVESITFFTDEELLAAGVAPALLADPSYVNARGVLDSIDQFDAGFFGLTPREAELMDPQHRLLLECAWEALEDAAYDPDRYPGRIAVYAGSGTSHYLLSNLLPNTDLMARLGMMQVMLLNDRDFLATRLSYKLNLKGPSVLVQTACSTGLVAIHLACQGLLAGEADLALAGSVSIALPMVDGYLYQEGDVSSPDGHCRAFDAKASGAVSGNGGVVVALKRLADAIEDGDRVYAVIRASAINNDGSGKVGFTAPSIEGQAEVITEALMMADVPPDSIAFVEGHGSGTPLGDPIEISALTQAFRAAGAEGTGYCALGSVKTNLGHLNTAAGAAGLLKAVLAVRDGVIPATLHFERPNPQVDFASSPFYVPTETIPWPEGYAPRRAAVSSFGLGGTNAHAVLEEAPETEPSGPSRPWQLLLLSARSDAALDAATLRLVDRLESEDLDLADVAFTLQAGRKVFNRRRALVCCDCGDAVATLRSLDPARVVSGGCEGSERPVAFLFPGLGDHYPGMARELYATEPAFAEEIDRCAELLREHLGIDVREVLFPPVSDQETASGPGRQTDLRALLRRGPAAPADSASQRLARTGVAQPALFVVEYALARLLMEWGIKPQAMIGYSLGEYVAACLAGVLSLEDALALVARRAKLIQELPAGAMLAVPLPEEEIRPLLGEGLSLSATNGPHFCVVGGSEEEVTRLDETLAGRGVSCLRLTTTHAFHSRMMEPAVRPLTDLARALDPQAPSVRYLSNVTGTWITTADLADPGYWARHMTQPVRFAEGIAELLREPELILLEVGPGSTLSTLVRQHPAAEAGRIAVSTLRRESERGSDVALLLEAAGRLWTAGAALDARGVFAHERRRRVPLPTYPFERQRCWIDPPAETMLDLRALGRPQASAAGLAGLADWFYLPSWRRTAPPARESRAASNSGPWLVFADRTGLGDRVIDTLRQDGERVISVAAAEPGAATSWDEVRDRFTFDPARHEAYGELVARLREVGALPRRVLHLWTVEPAGDLLPFGRSQEPGLFSLMFLVQALGEAGEPLQVTVVSSRSQQVVDGEPVDPAKATLAAALKVLPQECPHWTCRGVDVAPPAPGSAEEARLVERLLAEAETATPDAWIAWRGRDRWVRTFEPARLEAPAAGPRLRQQGVYLVTDGLHRLGTAISGHLHRELGARVALIVPNGFPRPEDWDRLLAAARPEDEEALASIRRLRELEGMDGEAWVVAADLRDRAQLASALDRVRERFGALHGVFHTAATASGGLIQLKTAETFAADLAPHVEGAWLLQSLLADQNVDFLLLCSSVLSVTGGFGQLEIAAAGNVLDALAAGSSEGPGSPTTITVHWDPYQWDSWLAGGGAGGPSWLSAEDLEQNLRRYNVPSSRSAEALARLLAAELPRVVVSSRDLQELVRQTDQVTAATLMSQMERSRPTGPAHARQLATPYVAPRNDLEAEIAAAWQELFGIAPIGVQDSFLELGGHSLLAIQVTTELRKRYEVDLPVTAVFETPTIAELAESIARARQAAEEDLEALLAAVEGLSPEEALRRMEEEMNTLA